MVNIQFRSILGTFAVNLDKTESGILQRDKLFERTISESSNDKPRSKKIVLRSLFLRERLPFLMSMLCSD